MEENALARGQAKVISKRSAQGAAGDWSPVGPAVPGRVPVIIHLLELKFGELPEAVLARVEAGTEADFERWTERVLVATTLDQVFDNSPLSGV